MLVFLHAPALCQAVSMLGFIPVCPACLDQEHARGAPHDQITSVDRESAGYASSFTGNAGPGHPLTASLRFLRVIFAPGARVMAEERP